MSASSKTPPSPTSLGSSANGSLHSFSAHLELHHHKLRPLEDDKIFQQLRNCDPMLYAAYRAAVKLDILQQALKIGTVKFGIVCNVFQHHGLHDNDLVLSVNEASDLVSDIFFASSKVRSHYSPPSDVDALTDASIKFALRVSDGQEDMMLVKDLKTFFVLLSDGRLREKFVYLFRQFADGGCNNTGVSRAGLAAMLVSIAKLAEFFGETQSFGRGLVDLSVLQCFRRFGSDDGFLYEENFSKWLILEPQILVWLPTHLRLISSKGVRHGIKCISCKMEDIIGMRYITIVGSLYAFGKKMVFIWFSGSC